MLDSLLIEEISLYVPVLWLLCEIIQASEKKGCFLAAVIVQTATKINDSMMFHKKLLIYDAVDC